MSSPWALVGLPLLYTLLIWWLSTSVVLYLDGLPRRTFRISLAGASAVSLLALYAVVEASSLATPGAAYVAFSGAVLLWGWNELVFLLGFLTGPRVEACSAGCRGWRHFGHAASTLLYHELALLGTGALLFALGWGAPNPVAAWTFALLWGMRLSAKLNLFLGVPNLAQELLPEHLRYLEHFLSRRSMNLLFPFSITAATVVTAALVQWARASWDAPFQVTAASLLASLAALGLLEHWLLVLQLPANSLWRWSLGSRGSEAAAGPSPAPPERVANPEL